MEPEKTNHGTLIQAYDTYADAIFRYCSFKLFDREKAKDIMQETFAKTWEYIEKGNTVDNMKAFLYRVAHNLCANESLRSKPRSLDEMSEVMNFDAADEDSGTIEKKVELSLLLSKMQMLTSEQRELLTMRYINDLSVSEIARTLNKLPNTVTVQIRRAEDALKKLYE